MTKAVGIDLGTTYSAIAYLDEEGNPSVIGNREGERITPSAVNFDENGNPVVGTMAKQISVEQPENTVQYVKRCMGDSGWRFLADNGASYSSEEISAFILKRLKEDAETVIDSPVTHAVITVPAYFDDARRMATRNAGQIAGLTVMKIINEPTAAALAYGCTAPEGIQETVAVFDLGGGTFDVTVMKISPSSIDVLSTAGDRNLGGFDFDNAVMVWLNDGFKAEHGMDIFSFDNGEAFLRDRAEQGKRSLTLRESTPISLMFEGKKHKMELSREKFNEMTAPLLRRAMDLMRSALEEAAGIPDGEMPSFKDLVKKLNLTKILLVGGSTRMPVIREKLEEETGIKPSIELNPDEVVAIGAAIQAGILLASGEDFSGEAGNAGETVKETPEEAESSIAEMKAIASRYGNVTVKDVNSHGLGLISVQGADDREMNAVVMPKNTPIPSKVCKRFYTASDNQDNLSIRVTEGDDESPEMVQIIGEAEMKIERHPKRSPLDVYFEYDASGIVHVSITDVANGSHLGDVVIKRDSSLGTEQLEELKKRMSAITVD